ncbi:MAG: hypothetical protein EBZ48_04235 [Proteobacteria bacterium]|nr:hypothetical protein [Pseudomonadota bacterium]
MLFYTVLMTSPLGAQTLVVLSIGISIIGAVPYVQDTLKGRTQPNRVTWTLWAMAPVIATGAALTAGSDSLTALRTLTAGIVPMAVLLASLRNPRSYWQLGPFDYGCGVIAGIAMVAWLNSDAPRLAVLLAALADGVASLPTLRKAWLHPNSETRVTYLVMLLSNVVMLPSITVWNIENATFPLYLLGLNTLLSIATYRHVGAR